MKNKKYLVLTVWAVVGAQPVLACDICSVYSANEAQGGGKGFFAGTAEQFTEFGTLLDDGHKVAGNGEYIDSFVSQIFAGYNFNKYVGVQFNLPIIERAYGSDTMHGNVAGIGDVSLVGNFRLYQESSLDWSFAWTALGGIKLPTGDSSKLNTPDSALPDVIGGHDIALGSGSVDGLVGTGFSARWKHLFLNAQMQYAIRSEGAFQHQYANDWTWSGGPGVYLALKDDYTVALQAIVSGESKGMDTFAGVPDEDSAETMVYLGPQISFTWTDKLSLNLGADLAVSRANTGVQVVPDYRVHTAFTWKF